MRLLGSVVYLAVWVPVFALAFIPMVALSAIMDAYRLASKAQEWLE